MAYTMRPADRGDLPDLIAMAEESGPGFTSLPVEEKRLSEKIDASIAAFSGALENPEYGKYLMMLIDSTTGQIAGCSAVKCGVGIDYPFFNYRIITQAQASSAADRRFDMDALILTNEFVGHTEVGTLFLREAHRGSGAGRLLAQSRYLLMATEPDRFGERVLAELRGVVRDDGTTPFWDNLGQHFFRMSFHEADYLSATSDNQFILDLMPKYPIYVDLLPAEAREVIGRCHSQGVGALKLLEWEGFRFNRVVDIFDGGPMVAADKTQIRTFRESRVVTVRAGEVSENARMALVSNDRLEDFRSTSTSIEAVDDGTYRVSEDVLGRLLIDAGGEARIWIKS